jgi:hypothetical protein
VSKWWETIYDDHDKHPGDEETGNPREGTRPLGLRTEVRSDEYQRVLDPTILRLMVLADGGNAGRAGILAQEGD